MSKVGTNWIVVAIEIGLLVLLVATVVALIRTARRR